MSTEGEVIDKVVDKVEDVVDGENKSVDTQASPDEDAEARRMGWLPEEEYKGDKSRWRDAKSFLERGKNEVPIMRERMKHMDAQIKELKLTVKDAAEYMTKVDQAAYARAYKDLKAQQKVAVATADTDAYDAIEGKIAELNSSVPKAPVINDGKKSVEAETTRWLDDNSWAKDKEMETFAYAVGLRLRDEGNKKPMYEFLDDVAKEVKRMRPDKFATRKVDPPLVEGGGSLIRSKGKGFSDLDADAKAAGERFVKQGLFKTRDDYAKDYFKNLGE